MSITNQFIFLFISTVILLLKSIESQKCSPINKKDLYEHAIISNSTSINSFNYENSARDVIFNGLFDDDNVDDESYLHKITSELKEELSLLLSQSSNLTILFKDILRSEDCINAISGSSKDPSSFFEMIKDSGKTVSDIGLEKECEKSGFEYIFLELEIDLNVYMNHTEYFYLYKFLGQTKFFWGFCLWKECGQFYKDFTDRSQNQIFFDYIASYGVKNLTTYKVGKKSTAKEFESESDFYAFLCVLYCVAAYILIRLILTIIGIFILKDSVEYSSPNNSNQMREESSFDEDETNRTAPQVYLNSRIYKSHTINNPNDPQKKSCFKSIFKFMDFYTHIKYLLKPKSKLYEESGLEYVTFFRVFLFFWITYNHNLFAFTKIPHRDFTNISFYTSVWFSFVKYSSFAVEGWVVLDGIIMSYKLMSFIKRNSKDFYGDATLITFMKFYFSFLSKIVAFFAIFFLLHSWMEYYGYYINRSPMFQFFVKDILGQRTCKTYPSTIFIPFYLQYYDFPYAEANTGFLNNCYRFVNVYLNEFYCFTFFMIIFYFAFKLKSKIYDYSVLVIFILNTALSFLSYGYGISENPVNEKVTYYFLQIDPIGIKYTHLFINTYTFGVFAGMIYFHYNNVLSRNPLENGDEYIPFKFTFDIMKMFDRSKYSALNLLFIFSIFMQALISMSFYFFILFFSDYANSSDPLELEEKKLSIKMNWFIYLLFIYERKFLCFFFVLMLLSFLIHPKASLIKHMVHSNLLVPFNRISFSYMGAADTIVYSFYSIYNVQIYINYQNMFFTTMGLIFMITTLSTIFTILFEVPTRIIYKNLIRKKKV